MNCISRLYSGRRNKGHEAGGDLNEALKAAAFEGSASFKWSTITSSATGTLSSSLKLQKTSKIIPCWKESEIRALEKHPGEQQVSHFKGESRFKPPRGNPTEYHAEGAGQDGRRGGKTTTCGTTSQA